MPNPHPKTDHLKQYQYTALRPGMNDKVAMIDMIKSGTSVNAFVKFWMVEAGYEPTSLSTMYYELKRQI